MDVLYPGGLVLMYCRQERVDFYSRVCAGGITSDFARVDYYSRVHAGEAIPDFARVPFYSRVHARM